MIRRGHYKFISSGDDPPLLFDLEDDPQERNNLAADPSYASFVSNFQSEVGQKWNHDALNERIRLSQRQRRLILSSYDQGPKPRWNHAEEATDEVIWYRGDGGYNEWAFSFLPVKMSAT